MAQDYDDFLSGSSPSGPNMLLRSTNASLATADKLREKLVYNRKKVPPEYYSSSDEVQYSVGGAIEDALLLASAQSKQKAIAYLKQMSSVGSVSNDYNDLLTEFSESQQANSTAVVDGLDQITGKFNEFREDLATQPNVENEIKVGLSPLFSAMARALGRLGLKDRRERFHNLFDTSSQYQHAEQQTEELKKELRSWIRVLVTYP